MKKLFSTVAALILAANLWAGVPQGFSFQAVVRNAQGELVQNNANVSVKVSILKDAADDSSAVYAETATATTNANGLLSLQIGAGTPVEGSFEKIDWAQGPFFIKTEIDIDGGENYSISSVQQLLSVPFAMVAGNVPTKVSDLENDANYISSDSLAAFATANINILKNTIQLANYVNADTLANYVNTETLANYVSTKTLNSYAKTDQNISSFNNDANYVTSSTLKSYAKSNQNISSFNNDAKYISEDTLNAYALKSELPDGVDLSTYLHNGSNISKLNNDAKYVKEGENISKLNNDAKYISQSEVDEKLASLNSQLAGEGMVDLGLPSGTLWATCNVGASNPWEIGDSCTWVDAMDNSEQGWNVPKPINWIELNSNCYVEKVSSYNGQTVNGYIFYKAKNANDKGKKSNPTASYSLEDAHIFVPTKIPFYWTSEGYPTDGASANRIGNSSIRKYPAQGRELPVRAVTTASVKVAQNATNAVTANKATQYIGDMPLVNVTVNVVDEYGVATASFLGQDIKNGSQTFVVPAYSPVFLSVALSKYTQAAGTDYTPYEYAYSVKINDEYFDNTGHEYTRASEVYNTFSITKLNDDLSNNNYSDDEFSNIQDIITMSKKIGGNDNYLYYPIIDTLYQESGNKFNYKGVKHCWNNMYIAFDTRESSTGYLYNTYMTSDGKIHKNHNLINTTLYGPTGSSSTSTYFYPVPQMTHNSDIDGNSALLVKIPNYKYKLKYTTIKTNKISCNGNNLKGNMKNQTVGPFPNAENTITITIMRAGGEHEVN